MATNRAYGYVGPADIKAMVADSPAGTALTDLSVLARWHAAHRGDPVPPMPRLRRDRHRARRRCPACAEITIVRDGDLVCVFCEADLPAAWNISR